MNNTINRIAGFGLIAMTLFPFIAIPTAQYATLFIVICFSLAPVIAFFILLAFYKLNANHYRHLNKIISSIGVIACLGWAGFMILGLLGTRYDNPVFLMTVFLTLVSLGIWLSGASYLSLDVPTIPNWLGTIVGVAWIISLVGFLSMSMLPNENPTILSYIFILIAGLSSSIATFGYLIWSLSMGWYLASGRVSPKSKRKSGL